MPPLSLLVPLALSSAEMSSAAGGYPALNAIDGDMQTLAASEASVGAWLSARVPPGARLGYVAIFNVPTAIAYSHSLQP